MTPTRSNPKPSATAAHARSRTARARNSPPARARASECSASSWMCGLVATGFRSLPAAGTPSLAPWPIDHYLAPCSELHGPAAGDEVTGRERIAGHDARDAPALAQRLPIAAVVDDVVVALELGVG